MTLAELGMAFWHDLAAPVIAGILASMIGAEKQSNWLNKRGLSNVRCRYACNITGVKRSLQHRRLYDARRTGHGLLA